LVPRRHGRAANAFDAVGCPSKGSVAHVHPSGVRVLRSLWRIVGERTVCCLRIGARGRSKRSLFVLVTCFLLWATLTVQSQESFSKVTEALAARHYSEALQLLEFFFSTIDALAKQILTPANPNQDHRTHGPPVSSGVLQFLQKRQLRPTGHQYCRLNGGADLFSWKSPHPEICTQVCFLGGLVLKLYLLAELRATFRQPL
jgi:hypothetical protein